MNITATLLAQMIAFALLVWFINRLLWGPLTEALEKRRLKVAEGLEASEEGKASLKHAEEEAGKMQEEARATASNIITSAEKRANDIVDQAKTTAQEEAERIRQSAQSEIDSNIAKVRGELRQQLGQLVVMGAERILQREVNADTHSEAIKELEQQF